jgi:acetoin utilization deacetylase AcuC-like enzyme
MRKIEELIRNSIRQDYKILDRDYTIENAMDILKTQEISTIIIENSHDAAYNGYSVVTRKQIANSIAQGIKIDKSKIGQISVRTKSIDHEMILESINEIISGKNDIILIIDSGRVIGFIDVDEVLAELEKNDININDLGSDYNGSDIDRFVRMHDDPVADIEEFYDLITDRGFNLTPELKKYFRSKIEQESIKYKREEVLENTETYPGSAEAHTPSKEEREEKLVEGAETNRFAIIYNPDQVLHKSEISSPENPDRLLNVMNLLNRKNIDIFNSKCKLFSDYKPARASDILRVHSRKYLDFVKAYSKKGGGFLGDSTYFTPYTYDIALQAAGGALKAGDTVVKEGFEFALALVRPPGHHATTDKYGGYCIFNNSAILARFLQRKRKFGKIMIIDWDAHSANGTMQIFYDDPSVLVVSIHQDPHGFYPNTGFTEQLGRGKGLGYNVNIEMPKDAGDREYMLIFKEIVLPLYESYDPDFIIGCNGFDAHHKDNFTDLKLTSKGYYYISRTLGKIMQNKLVILNEGGYHKFNGELTYTIINGLLGEPNPFNENYDSLTVSVTSSEKINKIINERIDFLIKLLNEYHSL